MNPVGWRWPVGIAFAAFAVYAVYSVSTYLRFDDPSYDLAIFSQAISNYAHLRAPVSTIKGPGFDLLGDHFSPDLVIFAPFYRLFPSPATLQVGQAFCFALAVVPITRCAGRHLGRTGAVLIGIAYAMAWGIQNAVAADFHEICTGVPLLAMSLTAYVDRRWRACALWALPLVLVKEDLGLTIVAIGFALALRRQWRLGAALAAYGVAAFALVVTVLIPAVNPQHEYAYWSRLPVGSHHYALVHAFLQITGGIAPGMKLETVLLCLFVTCFAALGSPLIAVVVPTLLWRFASSDPAYWGTYWHYNAVLMPMLFVATIDACAHGLCSHRRWVRFAADLTPPIAVLFGLCVAAFFPLWRVAAPRDLEPSPRSAAAHAAMADVPVGASVEVDRGLAARLVPHHHVYFVRGTGDVVPAYMAFDAQAGLLTGTGTSPAAVQTVARTLQPTARYRIVYDHDGYVVLHRTTSVAR